MLPTETRQHRWEDTALTISSTPRWGVEAVVAIVRLREVPESLAFSLRFPDGVLAHCDCSFASAESRRYRVYCAEGLIDLAPAFSYRGLRLCLTQKERHEEVRLREVDHFAAEMDHFSQCIRSDRDARTPGEEGLADMRVMAAIEEAARTGKPVRVSK